ncbi:sensor histidine kinase [Cohnella hashimotonis]|uniref:Sensor histidine kinase n=1 Tax=Cohnella hashimotonis TaxID=2826895 RepID=A0ABT6TPM1_9BACL|nr:sensor histidine kinase [Cohnella hashimotonis]
MRIKKVYRNYFQNNLFVKVILVFTVIVNLTIIAFSYFLFHFSSASIVRSQLNDQREAMDRVNLYMEAKYDWVQNVVQDVYRNNLLADNVSYLLRHSYQEYIQYTLGENYANGSASAANALEYFGNKLGTDSDIRNLILYSADQQLMYVYKYAGNPKLYQTNAARSFIPDIMSLEGPNASTPNVWIRKAIGQWDTRLYAMRSQINDKSTLKNVGQLMVYFDSEMVRQALLRVSSPFKGTLLVLTQDGSVMFDSSGKYYGQAYPYMDQINGSQDTGNTGEPVYISRLTQNAAGYTVVGIAPKAEVAQSYAGLKRAIVLIGAVCIAFAVLIPSLLIVNIAKRTNKIVRFMKKVEGGDLSVRLQDAREDELGQISQSFNEMVEELNRTIDREYKSEIKLKQTELAALQARVNPHFLYNTLEVIRMRAMSQGASDVGEMIYSLAALFRNSVRAGPDCTLGEELETCRLYLELFRIRFKDRISYSIDCSPAYASVAIPKMLLQPVVENYIVHGMENDRTDNRVAIEVTAEDGMLLIQVVNNGAPIDPERLRQIRTELDYPEQREGSFGLRSVHERLKLMYGPEYGIGIESEPGKETRVTIGIPLVE